MAGGKYILQDRVPVLVEDINTWGEWFERANRKVAEDRLLNGKVVSTVFLGLDHNWGYGPPILFETMIFGDTDSEEYCERYHTWEEAEEGHKLAVQIALGNVEKDS
jgi:hypothetical protein